MQLGDLDAHGNAQLGVEVGQRLVEEEDLRVAHDRPPDGDALALAAGELRGLALQQLFHLQRARRDRRRARRSPPCATRAMRSEKPMFCSTVMCG